MNEDTIINENYNEYDEMTQPNTEITREEEAKSHLLAKIAAASAVGIALGAGGALAANTLLNQENENGDTPILPEVPDHIDPVAETPKPETPQKEEKPDHHEAAHHEVPDLINAQVIETGVDEYGNHYAIVFKNGSYYGLLDTDGDGMYDTAIYDANHDGKVTSAEEFDISKQHLAYNETEVVPPLDINTAADTYIGYNEDGMHVMFVDQDGDGIYDYAIVDIDNTNTFDPFYSIDIHDSNLRLGSIIAEFQPTEPVIAEPFIVEPIILDDTEIAQVEIKAEPVDEPELPYSEEITEIGYNDDTMTIDDTTPIDDTDLADL